MSKAVQRRFGTTAEHAGFTGISGEFTYNTDTKAVHTHDGVTSGGFAGGGFKQASADPVSVHSRLLQEVYITDYAGIDDTGTNSIDAILADALADAGTGALVFPAGTYKITSNTTFSCHVVMQRGAKLKVTSSSVYLVFNAGFTSPVYNYCLDVEGPTKFVGVPKIYPQWFGTAGVKGTSSTTAMTRACRALRAASDGTSTPDITTGCRTLHLPFGVYECSGVPVYCSTIIEGEAQGSLMNSLIQQSDITVPALYMCPKNYSVAGAVLNNGVGQNHFYRLGLRSASVNDAAQNAGIIKFLSPAQATTLLGITGDTAGAVGHVDTMFSECWGKDSAGACIECDAGTLLMQLRLCTFDVVRQAIRFTGSATGGVKSYNSFYYGNIRSAFECTSSAACSLDSYNDEFNGCGNCFNATAAWQHAVYWVPTTTAGSRVRMFNSLFLRNDDLGTRLGGNLKLAAEVVNLQGFRIVDPESGDLAKGVLLLDGCTDVVMDGVIRTDGLASYTNSRLLSISQATQDIVVGRFDVTFVNSNAGAIAIACHSDYTLTGCEFKCKFIGNHTVTYNAGIVLGVNNHLHRITNEIFFSAVPASGTYAIGDRVVNSAPTVGQPKAWVCTVAGTPGTWVSEGNL